MAYLTKDGKGWVCEIDKRIVGFAIVGLTEHNAGHIEQIELAIKLTQ